MRRSWGKLSGHRAPHPPPPVKAICFDPLQFWVALLKLHLQGGPPAGSLYTNSGGARKEEEIKINEASLDVSSRRCEQKTKRFLQDPRRLSSRLQSGPEGWSDGCLCWILLQTGRSLQTREKSSEKMSPLWFGLEIWGVHEELLLCSWIQTGSLILTVYKLWCALNVSVHYTSLILRNVCSIKSHMTS